MDELGLKEAFAVLIEKRAFYSNCSTISHRQAQKDKLMFKRGKNVPEDRMRTYLVSAGAVKVQEEKWIVK